MYKTSVLWLCTLLWSVGLAVTPIPSRSPDKNNNVDCTGPIAFSSTGSTSVHSTGLVAFKQNVVNLAVTWDREVGVFTCACSGLYQFSFSGSTEENTRLMLKKRLNNGKQWTPIIATKPGGGSASILLEVENGDQVAVYLDGNSKKFNTRHEQGIEVTSFSGYRIAKS
ncbi:C1q domain-containing protein [Aphis craccivora]|uniref:C1q domain-containing protein n=1 Tax=Aphis craccivora TaxID=307492 RepID=A0A6G0Z871_APHCR|nr:C1q domain-containing protein [Aphis craccivora]